MSAEQLKAFLEAVMGDDGIQEKLKALTDGETDAPIEADALAAIARGAGFNITADDLLRESIQELVELSDVDLEAVAGGDIFSDVAAQRAAISVDAVKDGLSGRARNANTGLIALLNGKYDQALNIMGGILPAIRSRKRG